MNDVLVREVPIEVAVQISGTVKEFDPPYSKANFEDRYKDREHLIIAGYVENQPAGYIIGYDRDQDGSFYCWMAGVNPRYRRKGVLTALMNYESDWAKSHGYTKLKITTRNNRREMLANLVSKGFLFTDVTPRPDPTDNRISLEKPL